MVRQAFLNKLRGRQPELSSSGYRVYRCSVKQCWSRRSIERCWDARRSRPLNLRSSHSPSPQTPAPRVGAP